MEEIQRTFQTVKIGDKGKIIYGVSFPEGPTRILLFSERHSVVNRILDRFSSRKTASTKASDSPSEVVFEGHLSLAGAGVSLISLHSKELCYLHVDCVSVDCNVSRLEVDMTVKVQHLQLDNQTDTLFPVLLTASYQPGAAQDDPLFPFFYAKLVKARLTAGQSIYLEHYPLIKIKVRPMVFQVEENFLTELFRFFSFDDLPDQFMVEEPMDAMGEALIEVSHELVLNTDQKATRTLYYEHLNISSISFLLTFMLSSGEQALSDPGNNFVLILLRSIGGAVCNVSRTPIRLSQVQRAHAVSTRKLTYEAIVRHYRFNIIRELFKAFGSLAWLGNPLATLHEISFGLMSFGRLTFFGAKEGRLGRGLRMGCKALWSYTCSGVFNMIVSLLSTLSGLLCSCTLDPSYKKSRKEKLTIKPSTCFASILLGAQLFAHGLAIALIAIIIKPLEGYKRQGPIGLMKGLCRGLLAFIIRPLLAFLDLTTYLLNALVIWASKSRIMKRARPPRFIDADGIIRPYDLHASSGNYILRTMCNGSFKHEAYVDHISYSKATSQGKKRIVLLTNYHLFFLYNLNSGYFAKHEVLLRRIQEKVVTRKGINLIVKRASKSSTRKVKIKTHDTAVRERLLKMLECVEVPLTAEDEEAPKRQLSEESGSDTFWDEMESLKLRANALHSNEAPLEGQSSPEPDGSQMPLFGNEGFTDVSMSEE
ncbi:uncharacterized protein LOC135120618 [Zophobas morio]|uniref:uncharacterized protein LOC135120618 n=1 Tax=Zophobas morio TaxID=2755281 RepID=UPI00308289B3